MPFKINNILSLSKEKIDQPQINSTSDQPQIDSTSDQPSSSEKRQKVQTSFFVDGEEDCSDSIDDENDDPVFEDFEDKKKKSYCVTYEYVKKVMEYRIKFPKHKYKSLKSKFPRIRDKNYLNRFKSYYEKQGTNREKFSIVTKYCYKMYKKSKIDGEIISDSIIREWALNKATQINLEEFKGSESWIINFKRKYKISF